MHKKKKDITTTETLISKQYQLCNYTLKKYAIVWFKNAQEKNVEPNFSQFLLLFLRPCTLKLFLLQILSNMFDYNILFNFRFSVFPGNSK